jgi:hypothetical protein
VLKRQKNELPQEYAKKKAVTSCCCFCCNFLPTIDATITQLKRENKDGERV